MTNRYLCQCIICHCAATPGTATRHRTGYAHLACIGLGAQRSKNATYKEPVTIHAGLVTWMLQDGKLSAPYSDGTLDEQGRVKYFWLPRSQVKDNKNGTITIPRWLQGKTGIGQKQMAKVTA